MKMNKQTYEELGNALEAMREYEIGIDRDNESLLNDNNISLEDIEPLLDDCRITGKMEILTKPRGENQHEGRGKFKTVYVDQWSIGDSGDSFEGTIYGKISKDRWLAIPYDC